MERMCIKRPVLSSLPWTCKEDARILHFYFYSVKKATRYSPSVYTPHAAVTHAAPLIVTILQYENTPILIHDIR